jgi:hypothetical protein
MGRLIKNHRFQFHDENPEKGPIKLSMCTFALNRIPKYFFLLDLHLILFFFSTPIHAC